MQLQHTEELNLKIINLQTVQISSYTIVVADPAERLLEVPNENKQFRFGQSVKVAAKVNGVTCYGTGTVITASETVVPRYASASAFNF